MSDSLWLNRPHWIGLPCPLLGDFLELGGIKPVSFMSPAFAGRFFTWEALVLLYLCLYVILSVLLILVIMVNIWLYLLVLIFISLIMMLSTFPYNYWSLWNLFYKILFKYFSHWLYCINWNVFWQICECICVLFWWIDVLNFNKVQFIIIFFYGPQFWCFVLLYDLKTQ